MEIIAFHNDLCHLCLIQTDTAPEAITIITLNTVPSIPLLILVVWSNLGNKTGISSKNIL